MIPKIIHYCWFGGGEKPKLAKKCIESWKRYCPDYEIREWNETNFDVQMNPYTAMCYEQKKYAFLSDYVRLVVVAQHGGLYFDTDVELLKSPDALLQYDAFFGFETPEYVATGLGFGSIPNGSAILAMLAEYDVFVDGTQGVQTCPKLNTDALMPMGLTLNGEFQLLDNTAIFPMDVFNPYDDPTGRLNKTENTVSVHWYSKSWMSKGTILRSKLTKPLHRLFGTNAFRKKKDQ